MNFAIGSMNASNRPAEYYAGDKSESCALLAPRADHPVETSPACKGGTEGLKYRGVEQNESGSGDPSDCNPFGVLPGCAGRQTCQSRPWTAGENPATPASFGGSVVCADGLPGFTVTDRYADGAGESYPGKSEELVRLQ